MKTAPHRKHYAFIVSITVPAILLWGGLTPGFGQDAFFDNSLHHGARGMSAAYERSDGLFHLAKVPYAQLDCLNCHVKTCDQCHGSEENGRFTYSVAKAKDSDTCTSQCHGKQGLTFMLGQKTGQLDVHIARGMGCSDCHTAEDMHGDGHVYASMREPGAIKATCEGCHANKAMKFIKQGKKIPMMGFAQGEMAPWKGVVPAVHENLEWQYFNKSGEKWVPLDTKETDHVQWWYSAPITPGQLKALAKKNP